MSFITDIPPLEDMTTVLQQVQALKLENRSSNIISSSNTNEKRTESVTPKSAQHIISPVANSKATDKSAVNKQNEKKTQSFGGMKKGFLFGSSSNTQKKNSKPASNTDDIPFVKSKQPEKPDLNLCEVQEAMKASENIFQNREWVTDDLLKKVEKNETVFSKLSNPEFAKAITEFQTNPQAAMMKYANNSEMQNFLKEFCGIMGDHFSSFSEKQGNGVTSGSNMIPSIRTKETLPENEIQLSQISPQISNEDENKIQDILSSPHIRQVLMDEQIQKLFQILKTNPQAGERLLKEASGDMEEKIKILVDAGLLQVQQR
ncbi:uncharacterized protein LOC126812543 isoform X2 [Patella vulgata]|uniref:uncharacterized protein LOC126812543 isoform X2 n=1 Tax=Patella vulgata TaxID=6465 RepID=UPI0024A8D9C3|nr:uncharacterized protein LOC126812543 isoform X2 [Patella vulgata]